MHSGLLLPMERKHSPGLSSQLSPFSPLRTPGSGTWQHLSSGGRHLPVVQSSRRTSLCGLCSHVLLDHSLALDWRFIRQCQDKQDIAINLYSSDNMRHHHDDPAVGSTKPGFPPTHEELSGREIEVLHLLAKGLSNKQIAGYLVLARASLAGISNRSSASCLSIRAVLPLAMRLNTIPAEDCIHAGTAEDAFSDVLSSQPGSDVQQHSQIYTLFLYPMGNSFFARLRL